MTTKGAKLIYNQIPECIGLERSIASRKGKMYLDFLQNRLGSTLAGPILYHLKLVDDIYATQTKKIFDGDYTTFQYSDTIDRLKNASD